MAYSIDGFYPDQRGGGYRIHTYTSTDSQATVTASGYFNSLDAILAVGDIIECYDSTNDINYRIKVATNSGGTVTTDNANGAEDLTATTTLTAADNGKVLFLNSATEFATTLPAPIAGLKFKFIVKAAPASASYTIVTNGGDNVIIGGFNELEVDTGDDGPYSNAADTITFVDGVAVVGDWCEVVSDGTSWYLTGQTNADGGATLTAS